MKDENFCNVFTHFVHRIPADILSRTVYPPLHGGLSFPKVTSSRLLPVKL